MQNKMKYSRYGPLPSFCGYPKTRSNSWQVDHSCVSTPKLTIAQVKDLMDSNIVKRDGTFYSMVDIPLAKLEACCKMLRLPFKEDVFSKPVGGGARVGTGSKSGIVGTKKRKKSDKKVSKRPRTGSNKKGVILDKS